MKQESKNGGRKRGKEGKLASRQAKTKEKTKRRKENKEENKTVYCIWTEAVYCIWTAKPKTQAVIALYGSALNESLQGCLGGSVG